MVNLSARAAVVAAGLALVAGVAAAPYAFAADSGPNTEACRVEKAALVVAVKAVVEFNKDVYPGDVVPAVADVTPDLLRAVLADPQLGGGARAHVELTLAQFAKVDDACKAPATPTPTPTPSATPSPTTTPPPPLFADCNAVRAADKAPLHRSQPGYRSALDSDGDGFACEAVEGTVPVPSVIDTGKP